MGQRPQKTLDKKPREPEFNYPALLFFTPQGVASFGQTQWGRLLIWQGGVASLIACSVMLILSQHWAPVLNEAIEKLPAEGGLNHGNLHWPENQTGELAGNHYIEIIINPKKQHQDRNADLKIELLSDRWLVGSIFGFVEFPYPIEQFQVNRETQIPWWGARKPFLFIGFSCSIGLAYIATCLLLGLLGVWPLKAFAFFADRVNHFDFLWRLATAAWLPAGTLLAAGSLCYASGLLILLKLLILTLFCVLVGILYLFLAGFHLPHTSYSEENPFNAKEYKDCLGREDDLPSSDNCFD